MSNVKVPNPQKLAPELHKLSHDALLERCIAQEQTLLQFSDAYKHFHNLFENAPVAIIEIDYSNIYHYIKGKFTSVAELQAHFAEKDDLLLELMNQRKIKEVNKAAVSFFKARDAEEVKEKFSQVYHVVGFSQMFTTYAAFFSGVKDLRYESKIRDFANETHSIIIRFSTDTEDYSRTFVSFEDISEIKKVQEELETRVKMRTHELEIANKELRMEVQSREQIAKELRQSEARYRQLNAIYPVGIFHTDKIGHNTYVNYKACEIEGIKANEARGYGWTKNLHPDDKERVISTWENGVKYGIPINIDYRFIHDNKTIWVNGQTVPEYDENGTIAGYVGILADITKQREAEEQIKQNQIEIAHFSRLNSMGEVASGIAHELNQPLTAIISYASGIKRRLIDIKKDIPKEIFEAMDQTIKQAERAGEVIHHLKDFLRKGALSKNETDLNAAITDVLMFINRPISQAKITINLKLDPSLPSVYADKIHIEQVIMNIINNAIDAIVEANSEQRLISIRTGRFEKDYIRISISDSGPGIPPELIDNIFNPFVTTKKEGMGIGLSLCYNIVDKHGGKINVSTKIGKGTIFHIILPIK